jgi:perosamine synthetase
MAELGQILIDAIRGIYGNSANIPLHEPRFIGREREYVLDAIDSTFVSSVGAYVDRFESDIRNYTGAKYAIAVVNGTAALHMSLILAGVKEGDMVITQAMSFIATCNAISYIGATPCFLDIHPQRLGMSAEALEEFLKGVKLENGRPVHQASGKRVAACVPMHTFGFPCEIDRIVEACARLGIPVIEDAAESLGSTYQGQHTGTFGKLGIYSFNGNKTITCGGGGIIVTDNEELGKLGKHLTTQAKVPHKWEFFHDHIGYNYRCPNLNAALACAQLENLEEFIANKRETALRYAQAFRGSAIQYLKEPDGARANYWLNAILLPNKDIRDELLELTNKSGLMTRPVWTLMNNLPMFSHCIHDGLKTSEDIANRLINIPSSVRI